MADASGDSVPPQMIASEETSDSVPPVAASTSTELAVGSGVLVAFASGVAIGVASAVRVASVVGDALVSGDGVVAVSPAHAA